MKCVRCDQKLAVETADEECSSHGQREKITLEDIIHRPLETKPTDLEKKAVVNLVSRIIHHEGDNAVVTLPRRGRVSH